MAHAVRVTVASGLSSVSEVNLMEDVVKPLATQGDRFQFDARGFEIKTFKLKMARKS